MRSNRYALVCLSSLAEGALPHTLYVPPSHQGTLGQAKGVIVSTQTITEIAMSLVRESREEVARHAPRNDSGHRYSSVRYCPGK
jgi:hypothetical protein